MRHMDEFLTVAEIAAVLKVNAQTVRNWIDRGELPARCASARDEFASGNPSYDYRAAASS